MFCHKPFLLNTNEKTDAEEYKTIISLHISEFSIVVNLLSQIQVMLKMMSDVFKISIGIFDILGMV